MQFDVAVLLEVVLLRYLYLIGYFFSSLWNSFCFGQRFLQVAQGIHFLLFVILLLLIYYNIFGEFDRLEAQTQLIGWLDLVFSRIFNNRFISAVRLHLFLFVMFCGCILLWANTVQNLLSGFLNFFYFLAFFLELFHIDISQTFMSFGFAITICMTFLFVFLGLSLIILVEAEFHWVCWLWNINFIFSIIDRLVTNFIIDFCHFV